MYSRSLSCVLCACLSIAAQPAGSQDYPGKPIRVLTTDAGSQSDMISRMIGQAIAGPLGQPVIIDNRGLISAEAAAKAPPDGYTLLINGPFIWLTPFLRSNVSYDPIRDFAPITLAATGLNILVVHPSLPVDSVKALIAFARARPGQLNYGSAAVGGTPHLAAELFRSMTQVDIVRVPYKSLPQAATGLLSGEIHLMFPTAGSAVPHVTARRLKALAITSAQRSPLFPDLPTVAASGVPGYESTSIAGVFAPGKTPVAIINRLNQEIVRALQRVELRERFAAGGIEVVGSSPQQFEAAVKADMVRMGKVIRDAGIRVQ